MSRHEDPKKESPLPRPLNAQTLEAEALECLLNKAAGFGFCRSGGRVFESNESDSNSKMSMLEFVYFCVVPLRENIELAERVFSTHDTATRLAAALVACPNDVRFPLRR